MRAVLGVVSLLVALAVVGLITARQLKATRAAPSVAASQAGIVVPADASPQQVEKQVADDVAKALAAGAARQASAGE